MKMKNKGKVYPSPSSSSSGNIDVLSVLKLLPAAILALVSVLSFEDREVLAYLITRSMKLKTSAATASGTTSSMAVQESKKKSSKKTSNCNDTHKPPVYDCDCFDCYRSYWLRWNSSSNRELMDQAIEAFEDQLTNGEKKMKTQKSSGRGKRRDKMGRREAMKAADVKVQPSVAAPETVEDCGALPVENDVVTVSSPEKSDGVEGKKGKEEGEEVVKAMGEELSPPEEKDEDMVVFLRTATANNNHKGLARKVLPDVLGLLNSRLWSLWSPNV